jgi:hypothetical protein
MRGSAPQSESEKRGEFCGRTAPVGAAEGCDLVDPGLEKPNQEIAASFHSTAPTGEMFSLH